MMKLKFDMNRLLQFYYHLIFENKTKITKFNFAQKNIEWLYFSIAQRCSAFGYRRIIICMTALKRKGKTLLNLNATKITFPKHLPMKDN